MNRDVYGTKFPICCVFDANWKLDIHAWWKNNKQRRPSNHKRVDFYSFSRKPF